MLFNFQINHFFFFYFFSLILGKQKGHKNSSSSAFIFLISILAHVSCIHISQASHQTYALSGFDNCSHVHILYQPSSSVSSEPFSILALLKYWFSSLSEFSSYYLRVITSINTSMSLMNIQVCLSTKINSKSLNPS